MPKLKYCATEKDRVRVEALASFGHTQEEISREIGCSEPTLRRYFEKELARAKTVANAKVAETLFKCATNPDHKHNAARFFWLKCRAGWKEINPIQFVDAEGSDRDMKIIVEYEDRPARSAE